jgi:hypothetical protein
VITALSCNSKCRCAFHQFNGSLYFNEFSFTVGADTLIILNGPIVQRLGVNSGGNCLGPGAWANATLGRALRLILQNIGGALPGDSERSKNRNLSVQSREVKNNQLRRGRSRAPYRPFFSNRRRVRGIGARAQIPLGSPALQQTNMAKKKSSKRYRAARRRNDHLEAAIPRRRHELADLVRRPVRRHDVDFVLDAELRQRLHARLHDIHVRLRAHQHGHQRAQTGTATELAPMSVR